MTSETPSSIAARLIVKDLRSPLGQRVPRNAATLHRDSLQLFDGPRMRRRCIDEPCLNIGNGVAEHAATASRRRLDGTMEYGRVAPRQALLVRTAKPAPGLSRGLPLGAGRAVFAEATLASRAWLRRALDEAPHGGNGVASAGYRLVAA